MFYLFYLAAVSMLVYYHYQHSTGYKLPHDGITVPWTIFEGIYLAEKLIYMLVNLTFSFKYWIVSLTLRQALSNNKVSFSEDT